MRRGEIFWASFDPPLGRRPALIVTRDVAIPVLTSVTAAPITRRIREIASEVPVGRREGLPQDSVVNCDNLVTVPKSDLDPEPVGALGPERMPALDEALRYALGIPR